MPGISGGISGNLDAVQLSHLIGTNILVATPTSLVLSGGGVSLTLSGIGLTYDANEQLVGGTVTSIDFTDPEPNSAFGRVLGHITGLSLPAATVAGWVFQNANTLAFSTIFSGNDLIGGTLGGADLLRGFDGNDTIGSADGGPDTIFGGAGDDNITASATSGDLLNGGPGADTMAGGGGTFADVFEIGPGESSAVLGAGGFVGHLDHIVDWTSTDILKFTGGGLATPGTYAEVTAGSLEDAAAIAQINLARGIEYTVAQVGADVVVFDLKEADAVVLTHRTLADISQVNLGGTAGPTGGATVDLFDGSDMGTFQESFLADAVVTTRSSTLDQLTFGAGTAHMSIIGQGLTYDANGILNGGTVTGMEITSLNGHFLLAGAHTDASILGQAFLTNNSTLSITNLLSGDDVITVRGTTLPATDTTFTGLGFGGNDLMIGGGSLTTFFGGDGTDTLQAGSAAQTYLRGEDGNDSLLGGAGFDDINGNKGDDTIDGGSGGGDWLVGGQGNDLITAHAGDGLLYGNLGSDTLIGSNGADIILGGQADDSIQGGGGNDYISGDRGNDTESGGAGADTFHTFSGAGIDRVLDFNLAEGDHVLVDAGAHVTPTQVGADTVLDMGNGDQMILVGIKLATLTGAWIVIG